MRKKDEKQEKLSQAIDVKPLDLLNRDMRAEADTIRKNRKLIGRVRVEDDLYTAVDSLRQSIAGATACSGIYVWTVKAHIGSVITNWQARMKLYRDATLENQKRNWIKTTEGHKHVVFNLHPINRQWTVASKELRALTASFTLYVGQRGGKEILARLGEHCKASAQTWALKLSGTRMTESRVARGKPAKFFEAFTARDRELLTAMRFQEIACEIIPFEDPRADELKYRESMIRTALLPMIGSE